MENYFNRQIQLWGLQTQKSLQNKNIVIIGCGGLGCSLGFALGSSGIGKITVVDFDIVSIHNIHRQIAFKMADDGRKKCDVLKEIITSRNPFVNVNTADCDFEAYTKLNNEKVDLILDATDNLEVRAKIDQYAKSISVPWIYASAEEFIGQVCFFDKSKFESVFTVKQRTPNGIACPMVMQIASIQANLALRYLAGLSIKKDFLNYIYFDENGELVLQKFFLPQE